MKRKNCVILIMTIMLGMACAAGSCFYYNEVARILKVSVTIDQNTEEISLWVGENDDVYIFLPSYADMSMTRISVRNFTSVVINGIEVMNGEDCSVYQLNVPYQMTYRVLGYERHYTLTFIQSANIATIYIDTESGSMDYIHADKENKESGIIRLYTTNGNLDYRGNLESIKGRGNSTWVDCEKKPYSLKLMNEANFLDMGTAPDWILLANAYDPSNMRNKLIYDFAKAIGLQYSPDSQWVDLYLNGEYAGLYLLCERNEVLEERVEISEEGSFLISAEREDRLIQDKRQYVMTDAGQALRIHYADTSIDVAGKMQSVENAILADNGIDSITGKNWTELIDLDSWVQKYLIEEFFANTDGGELSQFYYYNGADPSEKVYAGPVWDYDASSGAEVPWQIPATDAFYANRPAIRGDEEISWFSSLYKKEDFINRVKDVYKTEFLPLIQELLSEYIGEYTTEIGQSARLNEVRWHTEKKFTVAVEELSSFLTARRAFLSELWLGEETYHIVSVYPGSDIHYLYCPVVSGQFMMSLPQMPNTEYQTFLGWYYVDTDEPFDSTIPITEDTEIYAKWEDSAFKRKEQMIKLIPLAVIACMGVGVLCADIRRSRKGG